VVIDGEIRFARLQALRALSTATLLLNALAFEPTARPVQTTVFTLVNDLTVLGMPTRAWPVRRLRFGMKLVYLTVLDLMGTGTSSVFGFSIDQEEPEPPEAAGVVVARAVPTTVTSSWI